MWTGRISFLWSCSTLLRRAPKKPFIIKRVGFIRYLQVLPYNVKTSSSLSTVWKQGPFVTFMSSSDNTVVERVEQKLREALNPKYLQVVPAFDDPNGSHVSIRVVSEKFENLTSLKRHQLVYKAIWEELQGPVHAVDSIEAKTPKEVEQS
ncbi:hypothetical protein GpartN1_g588.t1 [Galdieria partita]|uniref:BolA-like protein n=1 Tax=Galdieria partita TaxID=83374 RepID=A0A9C7UMN9_9RHOD|nr:hypothetical protein GpartN1_g588.t1 [Galdieria partita]